MPAPDPDIIPAPLPGGMPPAELAPLGADAAAARRKSFGWGMWLAVGWCVLIALLTVLAPVLPFVDDPDQITLSEAYADPSGDHWFGTDQNSRDLFARVAWGGRVSLTIGFLSLIFGFVIGGALGLTAGYFRGRYERVVMGAMDIMLSFPSLILALALLAALSPPNEQAGSLGKVTFVLTVLAVPALARITRANTLTYSQREFVLAARAMGAKPGRILWKEILPNVIPPMISFSLSSSPCSLSLNLEPMRSSMLK